MALMLLPLFISHGMRVFINGFIFCLYWNLWYWSSNFGFLVGVMSIFDDVGRTINGRYVEKLGTWENILTKIMPLFTLPLIRLSGWWFYWLFFDHSTTPFLPLFEHCYLLAQWGILGSGFMAGALEKPQATTSGSVHGISAVRLDRLWARWRRRVCQLFPPQTVQFVPMLRYYCACGIISFIYLQGTVRYA